MECALDRRTNTLIDAKSPNARQRSLVCPKCDESVFLREGCKRVAHFAHRSGKADPSCELYHSYGNYERNIQVFPPTQKPEVAKERTFHCEIELYLEVQPDLRASALLRIPAVPRLPAWTGEIRIRTPQGEARYTQTDLCRNIYIKVIPNRDAYKLSHVGEVDDEVSQMAANGVRGLSADKSLFRKGNGVGKRLGWSDPLYWGEGVWIVFGSRKAFEDCTKFANSNAIEVQSLRLSEEWPCVELTLPPESSIEDASRAAIAEFFERQILPPRPSLLILDPPPHHFSEEGEWVLASGVERVRVRRSVNSRVFVEQSTTDGVSVEELSDDEVEIAVPGDSSFRICLDNVDIRVRIEQCSFRYSYMARLWIGENPYSLEAVRSDIALLRLARREWQTVRLEFDSKELEIVTLLNGNQWSGNDTLRNVLHDGITEIRLEVGNITTINFDTSVVDDQERNDIPGESDLAGSDRILISALLHGTRNMFPRIPLDMVSTQIDVNIGHSTEIYTGIVPQLRWLSRRRGR